MKWVNLFFVLIFLLSAGLQYNDPDTILWISIYLIGAVLCWLAFRGKFFPKIYLVFIFAFLGYAGVLFFEEDGVLDWATTYKMENIAQSMKAEKPFIEDTREFFGLLILITALLLNYLIYKKKRVVSA